MKGQFFLPLQDGTTVPLRFCMWSLKRFCELEGINITDIQTGLLNNLSLQTMANLIRAAAEYDFVKRGEAPNITDVQVCDWVDDAGGINSPVLADMYKALTESLVPAGAPPAEQEVPEEEKKRTRKLPGKK